MSYTPTTWKKGDVITSAKLNKMEQGIANGGGGALIGHVTWSDPADSGDISIKGGNTKNGGSAPDPIATLDVTPNDIINAMNSGKPVFIMNTSEWDSYDYLGCELIQAIQIDSGDGEPEVFRARTETYSYYAASADEYMTSEYPEAEGEGEK